MENLERITDRIFYKPGSPEAEGKQLLLDGFTQFGRVCCLAYEGRKYPYRITAADIQQIGERKEEIVLNKHTPNQEILGEYYNIAKQEGMTLVTDVLFSALKPIGMDALNYISDLVTLEEFSSIVKSCQLEIFLVEPHEPKFLIEIYPEIEGCNTDDYFGSRLKSVLPVSLFTENQRRLTLGRRNLNMFGTLAFGEKLAQISQSSDQPQIPSEHHEGTFAPSVEDKLYDEWIFGIEPWLIKELKYKFHFIGNFATELLTAYGYVNSGMGLRDSPDHVHGKNAKIFRY